ncbi:hypothetical protein HORIV_61780 [Vreelandella olivaria]|uniref:Type I-E CRISPR-associated protein Cse1/CasA n=1 Tax=Vreelandella olivaria TaxID=390919 RepID=A0ABN5X3P8_9GAMM|nr:hypothetical protein HORIV_61780 [Halomonas olivaria]
MNLLTASWLPFRYRGGRIEYRPPSALADRDVLDLALPRADFQGAAWQFLIALLQTSMTPEDTDAWLDHYQTPPSVTELDELLAPLPPLSSWMATARASCRIWIRLTMSRKRRLPVC